MIILRDNNTYEVVQPYLSYTVGRLYSLKTVRFNHNNNHLSGLYRRVATLRSYLKHDCGWSISMGVYPTIRINNLEGSYTLNTVA